MTIIEKILNAININGTRIKAVRQNLSTNAQDEVPSVYGVKQALDALSLAGTNVGEIYNIKNFGAIADAVIPASPGQTVTGTNNKVAIDNTVAAAPQNALVLIPAGNYRVEGGLAPFAGAKTVNFLQYGNVYTNGTNYMTINAPGGADRVHTIELLGKVFGKVNQPNHTRTTYNAGTGPAFASFTGSGIIVGNNVNSFHLRASQIEGFFAGIEMVVGGGNGSQENTFAIQKLLLNNYGIYLRSTDGTSWCDKNVFTGFDGGHCRISGNIALKVDGGAASTYNGAFRSNEFHFLVEACTKIMECDADMTEPTFDITIEAGLGTGVFEQPGAIHCRNVSPNFVRNPKFIGRGVLNTLWLDSASGGSAGLDGRIAQPIYLPDVNGDAAIYVGDLARVDGTGIIHVEARPSFFSTNQNALPANFRAFRTQDVARNNVFTQAASYTVGAEDGVINCDASGSGNQTVNFPSATVNMGRELEVRKLTSTTNVSISGGDPNANNTIAAGITGGIKYRADSYNGGNTPQWRLCGRYTL